MKAKDEITSSKRSAKDRYHLYASIVSQMTLRTLYVLLAADRVTNLPLAISSHTGRNSPHIESAVFNGYVDGIDESTGHAVRPCLITVRVSREAFEQLDLRRVEPAACLKALNASVSRSPAELVPVRPVLEFRMVESPFREGNRCPFGTR